MDGIDFLFIIFGILIIGLIIWIIIEESKPYEKVDKEEAYKYVGNKIETELKISKEINDKTELEFFIFVPISTGKSVMLIPIPIYDNYRVFTTDTSLYLAFESTTPKENSTIIVRGNVEDDKSGEKFFIKVNEWEYKSFANSMREEQ